MFMTTPTVKTLARQSIGPHQFLNPEAKLCASVSSLHAGSYTAINPGRCIAAIEVNSELFRVFRGPSLCSRKVCVTGPVKSEAQQAMEKGARCARRPGAGGERHQRTQRPLALQRRFTHRRPFHPPPPPPVTFIALLWHWGPQYVPLLVYFSRSLVKGKKISSHGVSSLEGAAGARSAGV